MTETEGFAPESGDTELKPRPVRRSRTHYVVRRMTESGADPKVFSHEDKGVARRYVETNHPRGREVYLEHPDGYQEHFSADHKYQGSDTDGWFPLEDDE